MGAQSVVFEIIHESLMNKDTELSVSALCEIAGVSRSGYYRWVSAEDARNRREQQDRADFELILTAYNFRGYKKGVLGVNMRLLHMGIVMNPKKIRRLMRKYNLFCPFRKANPYRQMAKALRTSNVAANLLNREFEAHGARAVLLTDITYMRFHDGFLYLSTILDAYTKEALAHVLSDSLEIDFVLVQTETMIHSDQGCHYTSIQFIRLVNDLGLRQSMCSWTSTSYSSFAIQSMPVAFRLLCFACSSSSVSLLTNRMIFCHLNIAVLPLYSCVLCCHAFRPHVPRMFPSAVTTSRCPLCSARLY